MCRLCDQQSVDAHTHAACRRHAHAEGLQEVLVDVAGLLVAGKRILGLGHEAFALHDRVVELGVAGGQLEAAHVQIPLFDHAGP